MTTSRQQVICRECGAEGLVLTKPLGSGKLKVQDYILHKEECSLHVRAQPKHLREKAWEKQEKHANALVGARATLASGAVGEDGDGRVFGAWRVESKQTEKSMYTVPSRVWTKLVSGALVAGEEPLLHVQITHGLRKLSFCVIRLELYAAYTQEPYSHVSLDRRINNAMVFPRSLCLTPPAIVLTEHDFERLKRAYENGPG